MIGMYICVTQLTIISFKMARTHLFHFLEPVVGTLSALAENKVGRVSRERYAKDTSLYE